MAIRSLKTGSFSRSTQVGNSIILPGDYESIATTTVGSGGAANVEFTSIPSTFTHLQLRIISRTNRANTEDSCIVQFNSDTGSNYAYHYLEGYAGAATSVVSSSATSGTSFRFISSGNNATSGIFSPAIVDILDYANTNKYKTTRIINGLELNDSTKYNYVEFRSALWMSTNAITSIKFTPVTGTAFNQYSHFALYGIRG